MINFLNKFNCIYLDGMHHSKYSLFKIRENRLDNPWFKKLSIKKTIKNLIKTWL